MIKTASDPFDQSDLLLIIHRHIRVEQSRVQTSAFAELEHNARQLTVETHSECLHDIGMLLQAAKTRR